MEEVAASARVGCGRLLLVACDVAERGEDGVVDGLLADRHHGAFVDAALDRFFDLFLELFLVLHVVHTLLPLLFLL